MRLKNCLSVLLVTLVAQSGSFAQDNVFRSQSNVVLVPVLVTQPDGNAVLGLPVDDFIVEDNGVPQRVKLDDSPQLTPISLVVIVQRGGSAKLHFMGHHRGKDHPDCREDARPCPTDMTGVPLMIEGIVGSAPARIAVVTFDSEVQVFQKFTPDVSSFAERLRLLTPGDGGDAILDAVRVSLDMLDREPKENRKVLLLISEKRDHGSGTITMADAVRRISSSNVFLYSVAFSPQRAEFLRDLRGQNPNAGITNFTPALQSLMQGMRKNMPKTLAELSGGEYFQWDNGKQLDWDLHTVSNRLRDRYVLSFQPSHPQPGPHTLSVRLRTPEPGYKLTFRTSYWAQGSAAAGSN